MIYKDCKNNENGICLICIKVDGNNKKIFSRQISCEYYNLNKGYNKNNEILEKNGIRIII